MTEPLTPKQSTLLAYILAGKTNKVIAGLDGILERSVEKRRRRLYKNTGSKNIVELVKWAINNNQTYEDFDSIMAEIKKSQSKTYEFSK